MNCNSNVVVPELLQDECNGCFVKPQCIIIDENIPLFDITQGESLQDFILALINKIVLLENRVEQLENLQNV